VSTNPESHGLPLRRLGDTSVAVTELGFGGAALGNLFHAISDQQSRETVATALSAGVGYFDTAPLYGFGYSEHRLGEALRDVRREDIVVSTKVGRLLDPNGIESDHTAEFARTLPFKPRFDYTADGVLRSFEDSLQRLGTDRVDILLVHDIDTWTHGSEATTEARLDEFMRGGYQACRRLREEGVIGAFGAGLNCWQDCERLARRVDLDCFLLAGRYTLLEQDALSTFLPLCEDLRISLIIGGPFNTGILATGAIQGAMYNYAPAPDWILHRVRSLEHVCDAHGVSLAAAALQFPLHHPRVASVVPGMSSPAEVEQAIRTLNTPIPDALWADLKAEGLLHSAAPLPSRIE